MGFLFGKHLRVVKASGSIGLRGLTTNIGREGVSEPIGLPGCETLALPECHASAFWLWIKSTSFQSRRAVCIRCHKKKTGQEILFQDVAHARLSLQTREAGDS
jgi:hypothetical protein